MSPEAFKKASIAEDDTTKAKSAWQCLLTSLASWFQNKAAFSKQDVEAMGGLLEALPDAFSFQTGESSALAATFKSGIDVKVKHDNWNPNNVAVKEL
eukprot:6100817-Amphidinium_carterae.1